MFGRVVARLGASWLGLAVVIVVLAAASFAPPKWQAFSSAIMVASILAVGGVVAAPRILRACRRRRGTATWAYVAAAVPFAPLALLMVALVINPYLPAA